ncbi:uncharacterized protein [Eurosta solidaginis]|uniref:uncharacterized protein n=1 Tax=Eurosta solidaginis TaxID=178769 RepID=UPI0035310939
MVTVSDKHIFMITVTVMDTTITVIVTVMAMTTRAIIIKVMDVACFAYSSQHEASEILDIKKSIKMNKPLKLVLFYLSFISINQRLTESATKLTNIECKSLDKSFSDFKTCRLHVPKRGVIALDVHVELLQVPVNNVTVNLSFWKKVNGFRPFLYNITTDFCGFMAKKKRFPFLKIFWEILKNKSNANHTCPYVHDIIVKNLVLSDQMFNRLPAPPGEYMFKLIVGAYNEWKAEVKAYFDINLNSDRF